MHLLRILATHRVARAAASVVQLLYVSSSVHKAKPHMGTERIESFDNIN